MENFKINDELNLIYKLKGLSGDHAIDLLFDDDYFESLKATVKFIKKLFSGRANYVLINLNEIFKIINTGHSHVDYESTNKVIDDIINKDVIENIINYRSTKYGCAIKLKKHKKSLLTRNFDYYTYVDDFNDTREYLIIRKVNLNNFINSLK